MAQQLFSLLRGAYHNFLVDMQNYAVLFRSGITIDTVRSVRPKKWAAFLSSLGFEERCAGSAEHCRAMDHHGPFLGGA